MTRLLRRPLVFVLLLLPLFACASEEEKIATFLENAEGYAADEAYKEAVIEYRNVLQLDPNDAAAHHGLARAYLELKQAKEAYWELSEAVRLDGSNVEARLTLGGLSLLARNFEQALEQADAVIELDPSQASAYVLRGQGLEGLDRADEAEAPYLQAVETAPDEGSYLLVAAGYYVRVGRSPEAEPLLQRFVEVDPGFLSYSSLARFLAEDPERSQETVRAFERAIETAEGETRVTALQNLANHHFARGNAEDAISLLEEEIDSVESGGKLDLIYLLARLYRSLGNDARADELIESATSEGAPGDTKPHLVLSAHRGRQGDLEGALEAAEAALAIDPDDVRAKLRKAELLVDLGYRGKQPDRISEGRRIVEAVLEGEPTSPDALFVKGKVALALGDVDEAVEALGSALDSRSNWAQARFVLGSALTLKGDYNAARNEVARAVELEPELVEARRMLSRLHANLGEHEYAVEQGRAFLAERPDDVKTRILVAQSLVRIGRLEEAMKELEAVEDRGEDAELLYAKARLNLAMGRNEAGRALLVRAAVLQPHTPDILGTLLTLDRGSPRLPETGALIEAAVEAQPDSAELARLRGALAMAEGDMAEAERSLRRATDLDPTDMLSYQQLAAFYQTTGRLPETLETYERALEQRPEEASLNHFVAVLYELSGRRDEAIARYERAIELDSGLGQAKNNLAYLLVEVGGDLDRALDLAQDAKALMPSSGNAADTLGWVLHKHGRSSAAVGYLKEAVASFEPGSPNLGVVRHHLALAYEANDQTAEAIATLELALADLEERQAAVRAQGREPEDPEWSGAVRDMLSRLKSAG